MEVRFKDHMKPGMDELTIWEQHTITLNKDPKVGFGFALSGGKDKPHPDTGDTAVVVSDVLPNGPAMGRLYHKDQIVMVNGVSMENVHSNYTIQVLKSCGKTANVTVKRPRKIQIPATSRPTRASSQSNLLDQDPPRRARRYSDGSDNRDGGRYNSRSSPSPHRNGHAGTLPLMSGYKKLPQNQAPDKPIKTTLVKKRATDEYGLKLGSQIFIKHMTDSGLAAKEGTLQEGDLILKINGMTTENLSLLETKHLVEKSRGKLTMTVLRDDRKFLVTIPEVDDSPRNSEDELRKGSSSELEDISDIEDEDLAPRRVSRQHTREKRARRTRAEPPPRAKSRDSSPVRSTLTRPAPKTYAPRRAPSESESDRSTSPPARREIPVMKDSSKYKALPGLAALPNPRSSPVQNWTLTRPSSSSSKPRKPVSESDSDRSASPPPRRENALPDTRYKSLSDLPHISLKSSPVTVRQEPPRRVNSPVRIPPPDSDSESDSTPPPPQRHSASYSQDSISRYRTLPEVSLQPHVEPPRWSETSELPKKANSDAESDASDASAPHKDSSGGRNSNAAKGRRRVLSKKATSLAARKEPSRRVKSPAMPPPDESSESDELSHLRRSGSSEREQDHRSAPRVPRAANGGGTVPSGISVNNPQLYSKPAEEPLYFLPPDSYPSSNPEYSSDVNTVRFVKGRSLGLRLVGGNDVGIFVGGVQPNSPAYEEGMKEGDQILKVNNVDFAHFTREEAANFLLNLPAGERVELCTQKKMDLYKKIIKSNLGDNFYVRTHFDHEADNPKGLSFTRGEVFRVLDTMFTGKIGNWLAVRMGNDLHEMDKGTIPNQERAEKLATIERTQRSAVERQGTGPRAEFWKLRGLRGNKKNEKNNRRTREDLLQLTIQGKFPAYERVLLREANFKRPIVILGPLNDIAMEKLANEMPDEYEVAEMVPRGSGGDSSSTVIKLDTVRRIAEKDKHPLLDITPTAVERLNYIQYHPMVLFLDPHSRKDVKAMRHKYKPDSSKSSRRLYSQAVKMRKHANHLFAAQIDLQAGSHKWYDSLKQSIRHQQSKPVWVSEITLESGGVQDLDALDPTQMDYLSAASDLEDTDGEAITDGEAYTDNEDLEEAYPGQEAARFPQSSRGPGAALARSSEPALEYDTPAADEEPGDYGYSDREVPPLMYVPEPRSARQEDYSPPQSPAEQEEPSQRSFTDSDFDGLDVDEPNSPSDGPPDFIAPDPSNRQSVRETSYADEQPEIFQPAPLSAIEERLQQTRAAEPQTQPEERKGPSYIVLAHHHQAVQYRRTQIQGSDSSDEDEFDEEEEADDIEWGPATEL